ncbi:TRAP transporter substrate-binding protein [Acetomicrobium mobile]|jgi:tripartite ATP-independent transporter DctP family solute receptor|uniref:TRAP transporter substrate-binding protein n=1 Tax=Acetomicrobium mobile TaxID=97477 RepID=UPI0026ED8EFD|nr:TRAP transporter substrate-binding protein [Acetomicrobium mobile]
MKRRLVGVIIGLVISIVFINTASAATTLKIAFNQDKSHPQYIAMEQFGKILKDKTKGEYEVQIFPNELLGAQKETLEMVQSGTIAMAIVANALLENWNSDFAVFNLPYMFESVDEQKAIVNNPEIVGDLYRSLEPHGIKVLAAFHGGVRNVYCKKPINSPSDLNGLKIRVMQSDTMISMMNMMGGTGISMGQGDVYTAIQTGVIDGAENNELIYNSLLHYEVAPCYSYTKHLMQPDVLTISTEVWNLLPDNVKAIFEAEIPKAIDLEYSSFDDAVKTALANVKSKCENLVITYPDITPFQEAVAPLTESKLTTPAAKQIYKQILEYRSSRN